MGCFGSEFSIMGYHLKIVIFIDLFSQNDMGTKNVFILANGGLNIYRRVLSLNNVTFRN